MANKVVIGSMRTSKVAGKVKAFFSVRLGPLEIDDLKLIEGSNGTFIGWPSRKVSKAGEADKWFDIVKLARNESKELTASAQELYDAILAAASAEYERRGGEPVKASASEDDSDDLPF